MEEKFAAIRLVPVPDDLDGLRKLSFGEVDAVIMDVASASYFIEREKITNLRIFDSFDYTYDLSFGVRKDLPILREILSKTLSSIPEHDRQLVLGKWITKKAAPHSLLWDLMERGSSWFISTFVVLLLLGAIVLRAQRQRRLMDLKVSQYSRSLIEASPDPLVTISMEVVGS